MNEIWIRGLRIETLIGVPDEERGRLQEIVFDILIEPACGFGEMNDEISRTVDYGEVARRISELAGERPRNLIETLAVDVARMILGEFHARSATVEIHKFILPQTDFVAVRYRLERS